MKKPWKASFPCPGAAICAQPAGLGAVCTVKLCKGVALKTFNVLTKSEFRRRLTRLPTTYRYLIKTLGLTYSGNITRLSSTNTTSRGRPVAVRRRCACRATLLLTKTVRSESEMMERGGVQSSTAVLLSAHRGRMPMAHAYHPHGRCGPQSAGRARLIDGFMTSTWLRPAGRRRSPCTTRDTVAGRDPREHRRESPSRRPCLAAPPVGRPTTP
jgi:hypothetical protein